MLLIRSVYMASTYLFDYRSNVKLNKWWKEHCKTVTRYVTLDTCVKFCIYCTYGTGYTAVSQPAHCAGKPTHTKQHRLYTVTIHVVIWFLYHKCYYLLSHVTIFYKIILKISMVKIWNIVVS